MGFGRGFGLDSRFPKRFLFDEWRRRHVREHEATARLRLRWGFVGELDRKWVYMPRDPGIDKILSKRGDMGCWWEKDDSTCDDTGSLNWTLLSQLGDRNWKDDAVDARVAQRPSNNVVGMPEASHCFSVVLVLALEQPRASDFHGFLGSRQFTRPTLQMENRGSPR